MDHKYAWDEAYCSYADHLNEKNERKAGKITKPKLNNSTPKNSDVVYWELANGNRIDIDSMTIEHLRNVLKLIVRKNLLKSK